MKVQSLTLQAPTKVWRCAALAASFSLLCFAQQARAVVLEQKWQAGQQLPYDVALKGTANVETDALWAGPFVNTPIDIALNGSGQVVLNTLTVDTAGNGTVQVRLPQLLVKAGAFGMSANLKVEGNTGSFGLVGGTPKTFDTTKIANPDTAVLVSPLGQVKGVAPVTPVVTISTTATTTTTESTSTSSAPSVDSAAQTVQNIARLMPQLWPGRDIAVGGTWTIDVKAPLGATASAAQISLGILTMKLVGEENSNGRVVQRVNVNGIIDVSGAKAQAINNAIKDKDKNAPRVVSSNQAINGDVLFDAAAGQIARVWLKVVSKNEVRGITPVKDKKPASPWTLKNGFNGTVQMQQTVSK